MIEAMAILVVFLTTGLIYVAARMQAQNAGRDPTAELARLQESVAWHEERLHQAMERQWDDDMTSRIAEQLTDARTRLAGVSAAPAAGFHQSLE